MNTPQEIAAAFALDGAVTGAKPHGSGLINDTWLVTTDGRAPARAILQRLNRVAFPRPADILDNLRLLFDHVARRQDRDRGRMWDLRFPQLIPTRDGAPYLDDGNGNAWRMMTYIEGTQSFHKPRDTAQAREAGRALGRFHALVHDLDVAHLHDTRPGFHDTPRHLARLAEALAQAEPRLAVLPGVEECLDFVDARRSGAGAIEAAIAAGRIHVQPVHGDPKLDNFLFDEKSGHAVSLIDLDTFKPGIVHHDIADCLRSCCNRAGESGGDGAAAVRFDIEICAAALGGYFEEADGATEGLGIAELADAIRLIPFELGVRFLTDHLAGNRYFRTEYPEQNLRRAQTQFRLAADIERQADAITAILAAHLPTT